MKFLRQRIPELAALFFLLTVTQLQVLVNHFARAVMDPDFFWHVRVGDWILTAHRFPMTGIFSQHSGWWVAYSWGFEVPLALAVRSFGLAALPISLALFRAFVVFTLFAMLLRISGRFWLAWTLAAVASMPLSDVMVLRPLMFTLLFFVVELGLIFEARRLRSARPLYWLPLLFVLWANFHIQFVYGLFVLTLFIGGECVGAVAKLLPGSSINESSDHAPSWTNLHDFLKQTSIDVMPMRLILVWTVTLLATFIGPYWGKAYLTIFHYVSWGQQFNEISEFISLGFRGVHDYCVLLLLIAACIVVSRRRLNLFTLILLVSAAMVSFRSRRDEWFITIVACAFVAESLASLISAARDRWLPRTQHVAALVLACLAAFIYATNVGLTTPNLIANIEPMYPLGASAYVRFHPMKGPMYNTFNWGGFLIYNLREYPVSIDGRYDLYGPQLFERASRTLNAIDWQNDPDLKAANFALLEKDLPLVGALLADTHYKLVYSDQNAVIFVRTSENVKADAEATKPKQ
jgi:hypothetical protein